MTHVRESLVALAKETSYILGHLRTGWSSTSEKIGSHRDARKLSNRAEFRQQVGALLRRQQSRMRKVIDFDGVERCRSVAAPPQGLSRERNNLPQSEGGHGGRAGSEEANAC